MGSRVSKSIKNVIFGVLGLLISLIVSFISRSVFIRILGLEYNGVNGLFSNILSVLNLAELGFATSIAYALYKPLQENDEKTIAMIMRYFKKIYRLVAIIVLIAGCCCIPILQYLISEDISELSFSLNELRIYFSLYLASTVCSYLLAYRRTIITADQNSYLVSFIDNVCNIVLNIIQIILLIITRNFYSYLIVLVAKTVFNNIIIDIIANKKYPYLSKYSNEILPKDARINIIKNVKALFFHRVGNVIMIGTSSIIISAFVSLIDAGKYSNYVLIITNINNFINIIFNSLTASIGNLCLESDNQYQYMVFKRISYISNFFAIFTFVCYVCLFNNFIELWIGADMQFNFNIVIVISFNAMISYIRKAVLSFKDAMGLFCQDWYKPIIEAIIGISLAIGLSYVWGTFGVILGYTMATIIVAIPIENYVIFKYGLKCKIMPHILGLVCTIFCAFVLAAITYSISIFIPNSVGGFILKLIFVSSIAILSYIIFTCKTQEFKYYCGLIKRLFFKLKHNNKD